MRVLQINKNFFIRGGADSVFLDTVQLLENYGHEVSVFSVADERNFPSPYSKYFVSPLPPLKTQKSWREKLDVAQGIFRSEEVERKLSILSAVAKPQVAHIHNAYRELSASTFLMLRELRIPTVLTVHDMFPLCPNHSFMLGDHLAEAKLNRPYKCLSRRCINNSFSQSLGGVIEAYYYRHKKIWQNIDRFICPSVFIKNKLVEYGFPEQKMRVIRNPFPLPQNTPPLGEKVVYLGRLHAEKGIKIFMEAIKDLKDVPVVVAGTGPEEVWVDNFINQNKLTHVERRGFVSGDTWQSLIAEAKVVVVPSIFYENCSLSILEALSFGRLCVATNRGGNPELVIDGQTGFLAKPDSAVGLAIAIKKAYALATEEATVMTQRGQALIAQNHAPEAYVQALEAVYQELATTAALSS